MIPLCMCQLLLLLLFRYVRENKQRQIGAIVLLMVLLGGANYQAALLGCIVVFYGIIYWIWKHDKRAWILAIPLLLNCIGLAISAVSPGNKNRGGEEFGFSVKKIIYTICNSFKFALTDLLPYWKEQNYIYLGFFVITVCLIVYFYKNKVEKEKYLWIVTVMLFCMYCAMQAPQLYAGVSVSGGVPATNFFVFMLFMSMESVIIAQLLARLLLNQTGLARIVSKKNIYGVYVYLYAVYG